MTHFCHRNAAIEGYIQQFLYTYRFFCTPELLLQFIMEKFISAARYSVSDFKINIQYSKSTC